MDGMQMSDEQSKVLNDMFWTALDKCSRKARCIVCGIVFEPGFIVRIVLLLLAGDDEVSVGAALLVGCETHEQDEFIEAYDRRQPGEEWKT